MAKYRKLPIEVEAEQFFPEKKPHPEGVEQYTIHSEETLNGTSNKWFGWRIHTFEGILEVTPGDWIIEGIMGEVYPCKPDVFRATYEKIN